MEEPGRLQSTGSQRVKHDLAIKQLADSATQPQVLFRCRTFLRGSAVEESAYNEET